LADKAGLFHQTESLSDSLLTLIMPAIQASIDWFKVQMFNRSRMLAIQCRSARATFITLDNDAES
jgi:hypothetical protein